MERDAGGGQGIRSGPLRSGARNTLRLEAKLPLYGHEISDTINVWEAGLDRFCKMEKPDFIGRAALEKAKADRSKTPLVGLEMIDRGIARDGYKVLDLAGQRDRLRHQRFPCALFEEKYRAGLCSHRVRRSGHRIESGDPRAGREGTGRANPVLQASRRSLNHRGHGETQRNPQKPRATRARSQELKVTMPYPTDYKYTKEHEWIKADGENATVGITSHAQESLGDIVFVDLPKVGAEITSGKTFGSVESVKAVSDLYAPVSGTVTEVNGDLATAPEKINKDAHTAWMIKITLKDPAQLNSLLSAADYEKFVAEEGISTDSSMAAQRSNWP